MRWMMTWAATAVLVSAVPSAEGAAMNDGATSFPEYLVGRDLPGTAGAHEQSGRLTEAEAEIRRALEDAGSPPAARASHAVELERLRRLRRDYAVNADEILAKIRKDIPGATMEDVERWTRERVLQWITVDGAVRYFRREPANLFRFSADARARRDGSTTTGAAGDPAARAKGRFSLDDHLRSALVAADGGSAGPASVLPVRFRVRHVITVKPGAVPAGKIIRCWVPFPQEYRHQGGGSDLETTPTSHRPAPNGAPMRTVYLEQPAAPDGQPTVFEARYVYNSAAWVSGITPDGPAPAPQGSRPQTGPAEEFPASELVSRPPHLDLTPAVRDLAREIVGTTETDPVRKAGLIWRWIDTHIRYCAEMEYAVMPAIVEKMVSVRKGDCGVQALLFIALCRASGVPARWQSGWVTRPGAWNMHDWAEFWVPGRGWIPADPSVGTRKSDDPRARDFFFGNLDAYRMIANTDYARPFDPPKKHWPSDPVDNQRGEVEWDGGNLYYDQWDYAVTVESAP